MKLYSIKDKHGTRFEVKEELTPQQKVSLFIEIIVALALMSVGMGLILIFIKLYCGC
jgi:hypothetical protein